MSVADKGGRIAQALRDRMVCLSIEISESMIESAERFEAVLADLDDGEDEGR